MSEDANDKERQKTRDYLEGDKGAPRVFYLQEQYEVDEDGKYTRHTYLTSDAKTRALKGMAVWISGFFSGVLASYLASWLYAKFPPP